MRSRRAGERYRCRLHPNPVPFPRTLSLLQSELFRHQLPHRSGSARGPWCRSPGGDWLDRQIRIHRMRPIPPAIRRRDTDQARGDPGSVLNRGTAPYNQRCSIATTRRSRCGRERGGDLPRRRATRKSEFERTCLRGTLHYARCCAPVGARWGYKHAARPDHDAVLKA